MVEQRSTRNGEASRQDDWARTDKRVHQLGIRFALRFHTTLAIIAAFMGAASLIYWLASGQQNPDALPNAIVCALIVAAYFIGRLLRDRNHDALAATVVLAIDALAFCLLSLWLPAFLRTGIAALILIAIVGRVLLTVQHSNFLMILCTSAALLTLIIGQSSATSAAFAGNGIVTIGLFYLAQRAINHYQLTLKKDYGLMRILIDSIPNNLFVKDKDSRIVINNISHAWLLGDSTPEEVVGKSDFDFFPRDLAQKYYNDEQQIMSSGQTKIVVEEETIDPNGDHKWILTTKVVLRDAKNRVTGIAGINQDITAIKEAQMENDRLLQATQAQQQSLVTLINHMAQTATRLSQAAVELQAATTEQTATAVEQDAAVTQTLSIVEHVRESVSESSARADNVRQLSRQSMETSRAGMEAVIDSIKGMEQIQKQVDNITENILKLSSRTQQVSEIIETVNALADQSKLLALNASIEAARAGAQGRGFSIVASEVRQLAIQSGEATSRIRTILNEIQQATNAVVQVTEAGKKSSQEGLSLVKRAGESIQDLSTVIDTSSQAATQIATSAPQQLNGMDQVASAMSQIKQATVQFTVTSRQLEQNIRSLSEIAQQLEQATRSTNTG
jgi:PAS domain S-box-containing protein